MKKLLYPIAFALTAFFILYSCSAEEEDTTPPPTVQQPTPEPEPEPEVSQFTLTVTAGEGGSVTTGGTYDEGTNVTVTATPSEGYEFAGWEGSDSTEASLTISLGSNTNLKALFTELVYSITTSEILLTNDSKFDNKKSISIILFSLFYGKMLYKFLKFRLNFQKKN